MATNVSTTATGAVVGVFDDARMAQKAVNDLRAAGYTEIKLVSFRTIMPVAL